MKISVLLDNENLFFSLQFPKAVFFLQYVNYRRKSSLDDSDPMRRTLLLNLTLKSVEVMFKTAQKYGFLHERKEDI